MAKIKKHWLIIVLILIAAFLRLYKIGDYMEFLGDQGRDVVVARSFLKEGHIFTIGPVTSIGNMYLGPYYYYLFVVPGLILAWFNPIGPAIIVALLGVLTVYLIFKFTASWFNPKTAYITAFLYAISPVVIKYSNFSWNPNVMPLFALLFIHYLIKKKYIFASLAFIICLNSHYLALLLLPVAAIVYLFQKPYNLKNLLIPSLIFLISFVPQILFDIKHNGQNSKAIVTFFTQRETTVNLKPYKALPQIGPLFNQLNTRLLGSKNPSFGYVITTIFALLLIINIYQQLKTRKFNTNFWVLFLWLFIGLTGLALYKQHIYDHYFGFLYPVLFILFSYLIARLPKGIIFLCLISLTTFAVLENPFRWPAPKQLATTYAIDQSIIKAAGNQPFNFGLLAKMNYDPGYRYFLSESNAKVELLQNKITDQIFVVCEPFQIDCNPINNPEWSVAAFGWAKIDSQWEINGIKIFKLVHNSSGLR